MPVRTRTEAAYLLSERRKDEMLRLCRAGLEAMVSEQSSRNWLRLEGVTIEVFHTPRTKIRAYLADKLNELLGDEK